MLSATNSITDAKARLGQTYDYYGYASDGLLVSDLTIAFDEAKLFDLLPHVGANQYDTIQAKDKVSLNTFETYIYSAEVYLALSRFLDFRSRAVQQSQAGTSDEIEVEGYKRKVDGSLTAGLAGASKSFYLEGIRALGLAGYTTMRLQRGDTLFTQVRDFVWSGPT